MVNCNRVAARRSDKRHFDHHFMKEDKVKELVMPQALKKMFQLVFSERPADNGQRFLFMDRDAGMLSLNL